MDALGQGDQGPAGPAAVVEHQRALGNRPLRRPVVERNDGTRARLRAHSISARVWWWRRSCRLRTRATARPAVRATQRSLLAQGPRAVCARHVPTRSVEITNSTWSAPCTEAPQSPGSASGGRWPTSSTT